MSKTYKVRIKDGTAYRQFYIPPNYVETYASLGYEIFVEEARAVDITHDFLKNIEKEVSNGVFIDYYASKDGISFKIPIIKIPLFFNKGYTILVKSEKLLEDPWSEIEAINLSSAVE